MSSGGSLNVAARLFCFDTQADIAHILTSVRAGEISAAHKNELRDLVFSYTSGGHDPALKILLENKLQAYHVIPTAGVKSIGGNANVVQKNPIGGTRKVPQFSLPIQISPKPTTTKPFQAPAISKTDPVATPSVLDKSSAVRSAKTSETPVAPASPVTDSSPVTTTTKASTPEKQKIDENTDTYIRRIQEIKKFVNEKVGNPVALIDINNEIGREYMAALLDVIKKINGGVAAGLAMKRLELSFVAVQKIIAGQVAPSTQTPTKAPAAAVSIPIPASPEKQSIPIRGSKSTHNSIVTRPATTVIVDIQPTPLTEPVVKENLVRTNSPDTSAVSQYQTSEVSRWEAAKASDWKSPQTSEAPAPIVGTNKIPSLAEIQKPHQSESSGTAYTQMTSVTSDTLVAPEVTEGLNQLLIEWPLFKKSGLFGTGPKGQEHPLFTKIAQLPVPLLLAGRFEGATQEIKQSITDYMNGWRYEQGIIYEQGETFEHYLRRVIRHILDLQNKKPRS